MSDPDGPQKRLLIEFVLSPEVASPGSEVDLAGLEVDIAGFTVDLSPGTASVTESRHGPMIMIRGEASDVAAVGSDPRVVGVWLDQGDDPSAEAVAPEWSDPDVEGPERYLF